MGGYTSKCEKKSKSLHPNVHLTTHDVEEFDGGRPPGGDHHPPRLAKQPSIRRGQVPKTTNLSKFCVFYLYYTYNSLLCEESPCMSAGPKFEPGTHALGAGRLANS